MTCVHIKSSPASSSRRQNATTEDYDYCVHRSIPFQTYCHRVYLITRVLELSLNALTGSSSCNISSHEMMLQSQSSTRRPRRHLSNSLPHAPSDQLWPGRYIHVLLRDFVVSFHALSPRVASCTPTLFLSTSASCFHVLRADSIAVVNAVTPSARCAWSVLLPAVGYALGFLGPFPGCFFSF